MLKLSHALTSVACLAATAALAQPAPTAKGTTVAPLTVQGAPTPKTIHEQARSFVQTYAAVANPEIDQIGRWRDPVCVMVLGLPLANQAATIKAHIEAMAVTLGLPAARAGCRPNVEIAFTDKPQAEIDVIAKRQWPLLGYYHRSRTKDLKTVTHSIQAWYVTATGSDAGSVNALMLGLKSQGPPPPTLAYQLNREVIDDPTNPPPVGCIDRLTACYKSAFKDVLIMADSKVLDGAILKPIADDMVMLALSQPKSIDGCNALPSVIDRFAKSPCLGRDPPEGLTPTDIAYLTALYSSDLNGDKNLEQSDIASRMAKTLIIDAKADGAVGAGSTGSPPADAKVH